MRLFTLAQGNSIDVCAALPGFAILRGFVPAAVRDALIFACQSQLKADWHTPQTRGGLSFSVKIACFGERWTAWGYQPGTKQIPVEITEWSRRAVQAIFQQYGDWQPQTAICNWYDRSAKLGLHVDRQEREGLILAGSPIVTFSFGDDAVFQIRADANEKLREFLVADSDVIVMGGPARRAEHGIKKIKPATGPGVGKSPQGRLSITVRQVR